jgi:hypothetical protein
MPVKRITMRGIAFGFAVGLLVRPELFANGGARRAPTCDRCIGKERPGVRGRAAKFAGHRGD